MLKIIANVFDLFLHKFALFALDSEFLLSVVGVAEVVQLLYEFLPDVPQAFEPVLDNEKHLLVVIASLSNCFFQ